MDLFKNATVSPPQPVIQANSRSGRRRIDPNQLSFDGFLTSTSLGAASAQMAPVLAEDLVLFSRNYRIMDSGAIGEGSVRQKYKQNVEAIRLLKMIESEGREATSGEKSVLVRYSGWGGIPQVFDPFNREWEKEHEEIEVLLTEDEHTAAKASTPNAHYTPLLIIRFIYDVLSRMGFRGGRILEPSMGVGHFFGILPQGISFGSRLCGVELDSLTGRIAKLLYPEADIRVAGFEDSKFPDNFFDLAISNVPFGNYRVHDPRYDRYKFSIHDYFFAKAVDVVRPGGIIAFITSMFTLDKKESRMRKYLLDRADLVGAVRLPNTAFKGFANTSVTSDIIFLQKREGGVLPASCSWIETKPYPVKGGVEEEINEYFIEKPWMMLGRPAVSKKMYRRKEVTLNPDGRPLEEALKEVIRHFPEALLKDNSRRMPHTREQFLPAPESLKEGAFTIVSGRLYVNSEGTLTPYEASAGKAKRIAGLITIRDAAKGVLCDELTSSDEASVEVRRRHLNALYDRFVLKHGYINSRENRSAFSDDPDYPLALSLEIYDEDTQKAQKADIFSKRVIHPEKRIERTETAQEALLVSLNETSRVDFGRMKELTGMEVPELQRELEGLVFLNPEGDWEAADEYLSGNVRRKLDAAEGAALIDSQFTKNVGALKAVQPKPLDFSEISVSLGASWMPTADIRDFVEGLLKMRECIKVSYSPIIGTWTIDLEESKKWTALDSVENTNTWGTSRCNALQLIRDALNHRIPTVKDEVDDRYVVNVTETEAAREKQFLIKERFRAWVWEDTGRRERLTRLYNEIFNNLRPRTFDGSHLTLPGISSQVTLRQHQKDAIWRIVQTGNTLLAHVVGSGKAQPLDAKVLTPAGWKLMGDIRPGDMVIAGDGKPTVVEGVFPQGGRLIFRVLFSDGTSTECCDEHLWLTYTYRERGYIQSQRRLGRTWPCATGKVRSLSEIRNTLKAPHLGAKNHSIPMVGMVEFAPRQIGLDPYLLGVLIGDGCLRSGSVMFSTADAEMIELVRNAVPKQCEITHRQKNDYAILWKGVKYAKGRSGVLESHPVKLNLGALGLWGLKSHEKFIPDDYLFNSVAVRLALLQGLMDTDGWVSKCYSVYFTTSSKRLADGVTELAQSLGGTVKITEKLPKYVHRGERRVGKKAYALCLSLPPGVMPFRLQRKARLVRPKSKYIPVRYIVAVEPVGRKPAQCIRVAHPDQLYVTDDYIVTHNTFIKTAAAMEMKRLGLVSKPMLIVPNHLLEQWSAEFLRLYPLANVLIAGRDDFTPLKRKRLMAKIAANNWDAVIITHSSFEKLPMSKEAIARFIRRQIDELEDAILSARGEEDDSRIVKELEKAKKRLEAKIKERLNEKAKDDGLSFEELGIDMLLVDEADVFKNLYFVTKMTRVAGLPNSESNRAFDLYVKTQWMFERKYPVVFGTGTPVSNTMAELYTMQRYLQPDALREYGIRHFDSWAATFGEVVTSLEIAPDGSGYRLRSRFARFNNLPELLQIWRLVTDVQTDEMLDIEKPGVEGGKAETVVAPASEDQKRYVEELVARAEEIRKGHVTPSEDNMLKLTSDGRKAALDIRLIFPTLPDYPDSKTNLAAQRIYDRWKEASSFKGTQLVFCDLSTPKSIEFNVYSDIKKKLVGMGIPETDIAFIHEADTDVRKKVLFFKVNSGSVRVLMGSTEKMGAGTNVQKRLKALHHIDAPWRPRDIEQREGRILRQGNENETVAIYRYVTEGTFDAFMWQVLESKARFIAQIMTGKLAARSADDIEGVVLTYAEVKALASGNPLVMEKFKVDTEVKRLQTLQSQHRMEKYRMESEIGYLLPKAPSLREDISSLEHDLAIREVPEKFGMTINGIAYSERKEAGNEILKRALYLKGRDAYEAIGSYAGFTLFVKSREGSLTPTLVARGKAEHTGTISDSEVGTIASLEYALKSIERRLAERREALSEAERRLDGLRTELSKPFQYEGKLRELLHRQYEIGKQLDLDKRESTQGLGEEEAQKAA